MSDRTLKKRNNKYRYKAIKKTNIVGPIIFFLLFVIISAFLMITCAGVLIVYITSSKLEPEYKNISYMAQLYEMNQGKDNCYELLDASKMEYIIRDKDGKDIHVTGNDTCAKEAEQLELTSMGDSIMAYEDIEIRYLFINDNNLGIDLGMFIKAIKDGDSEAVIEDLEGSGKGELLGFPIWFSVPLDNNEEFIGKAICMTDINDVILILVLGGTLVVLLAVFSIVALINGIANVIRQRKAVNIFFADDKTTGRNWAYYMVYGEKMLKSWFNSKNNYAVVSLNFKNYRNYCLCHSAEEGETILQRIYTELAKCIDRREICTRASSSTFSLVLKYNNEEEVKKRILNIIDLLESVDPTHNFCFQAGINFIPAKDDENGKAIKRNIIDLEVEYNNASTARATLEETDESGVMIFDSVFVDEMKWIDTVQAHQEAAVRNNEFVVFYQPKYDPSTRQLDGAEALIRWNSPEFGFVPPGRFIPIFEKNGFITQIDHYMIKHVAEDQKKWMDQGFRCVPVSVNVSRAHFAESDLAEQILSMVDTAGAPHNLIEIELTESAFFDDKNAMLGTIKKLKEYGFSVSMDDFGSGYSSLNSLKDMPLDVLKLDAEFFRGDFQEGRGKIVVSEAIKLGKSLNMKIVAEGIEEKSQVEFLAEEECDMIQGYYFAKPMPGNEYEERMRQIYKFVEEDESKKEQVVEAEHELALRTQILKKY
ncbi:MAG: EAL domain-containing protein [Eubacterium sp.]|nr:EAL domain-containing protein [Eubacterium sp.]